VTLVALLCPPDGSNPSVLLPFCSFLADAFLWAMLTWNSDCIWIDGRLQVPAVYGRITISWLCLAETVSDEPVVSRV